MYAGEEQFGMKFWINANVSMDIFILWNYKYAGLVAPSILILLIPTLSILEENAFALKRLFGIRIIKSVFVTVGTTLMVPVVLLAPNPLQTEFNPQDYILKGNALGFKMQVGTILIINVSAILDFSLMDQINVRGALLLRQGQSIHIKGTQIRSGANALQELIGFHNY